MVFSVFILTEPNDESAANVDAAKTWREDRKKFEEIAGRTVRKSLGLWPYKLVNIYGWIFW